MKFEIFLQPSTVPIEGSAINKDDLNDLFETEKEKIAPILYLNPTDEGDLDDYVVWLRLRQKGTGKAIESHADKQSKKGKDIGTKDEPKGRRSKSTRQEKAKQRVKIKPLRDKLNRIEKEIDKATEARLRLDQELANPEIYSEANKDQLRELLFDQARNAQVHQELESRWLEASELLEQADVPTQWAQAGFLASDPHLLTLLPLCCI